MSYLTKAKDLYDKIYAGQLLDAFEQNYHEDVVMIEPTGEPRVGKNTNREAEKKFLASVKEWHGGGVNSITANEEDGVTMVESWMEVTFQDGKKVRMQQIARQKWQEDQIIEERFYYNA